MRVRKCSEWSMSTQKCSWCSVQSQVAKMPGILLKRVVFVNGRSRRTLEVDGSCLLPGLPWDWRVQWSLLPSKVPCRSPSKKTWERCLMGTAFARPPAGYIGLLIHCLCWSLTLSLRMRDVNYLKRLCIEQLTCSKPVLHRRPQQVVILGNHDCKFLSYDLTQSLLVCFPLSYLPCGLEIHPSSFIFSLLIIFLLLSPYSTFFFFFWSIQGSMNLDNKFVLVSGVVLLQL